MYPSQNHSKMKERKEKPAYKVTTIGCYEKFEEIYDISNYVPISKSF